MVKMSSKAMECTNESIVALIDHQGYQTARLLWVTFLKNLLLGIKKPLKRLAFFSELTTGLKPGENEMDARTPG